jgi:hypothetical protein
MSFCFPAIAAVTSLDVQPLGYTGQYLEATSTNIPVLHIHINASSGPDTMTYLEVKNVLNSWLIGSASEPVAINLNTVRLWYAQSDSNSFTAVSPVYVTHLASINGTFWSNSFSQPIVDNSGFWVTVDIADAPSSNPGSIEMQTQSLTFSGAPGINSTNQPAAPSVFLITDVTPAGNLEVTHLPGSMQAYVSTGQQGAVPFDVNFYNDSPPTAADINLNRIAFTVGSYPVPGSTLIPSSILADIKLVDKNQGTKYGEITQLMMPGTLTNVTMPLSQLNVPTGVTIQTSVQISLASSALPVATDFVISLSSVSNFNAFDSYTLRNVSVSASASDSTGFPMYSNFARLQNACQLINASQTDALPDPTFINKGATNVELMKFYFSNPGDTTTASAEIYNIKLYAVDSSGAGIIPKDLFSKISLTDESGNIKYMVKTWDTMETSGNSMNFSMTNTIIVPAASGVAVVVRADTSVSSIINNFRVRMNSASDIICRDKNSLSAAPVVMLQALASYSSPLCILSSSFKASHTALMPANIYPGQASVRAMDLVFSSPLSFGNGNILVSGITLSAKDSGGNIINFSDAASKIRLAYGAQTAEITAPASGTAYIAFPQALTIPALPATAVLSVYLDLLNSMTAASIQVELENSSIKAYQDLAPGRDIFVSTDLSDQFPMSSGVGYVSSDSSGVAFTNYPNPFKNGGSTIIAYYLKKASTVSISIYDMSGSLVHEILKDTSKPAGSHEENTWDGRDRAGRMVIAGTYLAKIQIKDPSGTKKHSRKITFIK